MTLEQIAKKTEYRIITERTYIADRYLQFKSTTKKMNFPDFWNTHDKEVWRFIPKKNQKIFGYIGEKSCPTYLLGNESNVINCFNSQEDYEVIPFTKEYPDISKYFEHFNTLRDQYLKKEQAANSAGTIVL